MPRTRLLLLLAVLAILPASPTRAGRSVSHRVVVVSHGVKLRLTVPRVTYPTNALIGVTIRIQNISRHPVYIPFGCLVENPTTQIVDAAGGIVYPPAFIPAFPPHSCPLILSPLDPSDPGFLRPGKAITRHTYAIARANRVRASLIVMQVKPGRRPGLSSTITTPSITISLTTASAPAASLRHIPEGEHTAAHWSIAVRPPSGVRGPLLFADEAECLTSGHEQVVEGPDWAITQAHHIDQPCEGTLLQWHVIAGWVGRPVTRVDYIRP